MPSNVIKCIHELHEPQETAMVYEEAVHEALAQNTDDIVTANTETL